MFVRKNVECEECDVCFHNLEDARILETVTGCI